MDELNILEAILKKLKENYPDHIKLEERSPFKQGVDIGAQLVINDIRRYIDEYINKD